MSVYFVRHVPTFNVDVSEKKIDFVIQIKLGPYCPMTMVISLIFRPTWGTCMCKVPQEWRPRLPSGAEPMECYCDSTLRRDGRRDSNRFLGDY